MWIKQCSASGSFLTATLYSRLPALDRRVLRKPFSSVTNGKHEALEKMLPVIIPSEKVKQWLMPVCWKVVCSSSKDSVCPALPKALHSTVCSRPPTLKTASISSFDTFSTGTVARWRMKVKLFLVCALFPSVRSNSSDCWLINPWTTLTGDDSVSWDWATALVWLSCWICQLLHLYHRLYLCDEPLIQWEERTVKVDWW